MKNNFLIRLSIILLVIFTVCASVPTVFAVGTETAIEFGSVQGKAGQEISVPVTIKNNPGIATFRFRVAYDNKALELKSVINGEILTKGMVEYQVNEEKSFVTFLWYSTDGDITGDGEIAVLKFKISDDAGSTYPLTVTCDPDDIVNSVRQKIDYSVKNGLVSVGSNVTGKITSFGVKDGSVTLKILSGNEEVSSTVSTTGEYSLKSIPSGSYILEVSKLNHATRKYEITVSETDFTMDVKIHLIGDINGDGKVNITDVNKANAHANKSKFLKGYEFDCANINGDDKVNITDVNKMNAHANKSKYLW